jgi:glucosamine--fructose-6-phosphate aminotransferase (isomerizing)
VSTITYLASDATPASVTQRVVYLEEGDVADITRDTCGSAMPPGLRCPGDRRCAGVGCGGRARTYRHYMQKEIFEQPRAIADTLESVGGIGPDLFGANAAGIFAQVDAVHLLACGTSYYSALLARLWLEGVAGIRAQAEIASEYRYRDSVPDPAALVVVISQSGETADTLAALKHARKWVTAIRWQSAMSRRARWYGRRRSRT